MKGDRGTEEHISAQETAESIAETKWSPQLISRTPGQDEKE
jgi:hypothetical protein